MKPKPTRKEFVATIEKQWPGATLVEADRGLYVVVGSKDVAERIGLAARAAGYKPIHYDERGPEDFRVTIFGFPRAKKG